jgi:septation ring formation regulator EzrA
MTAGLWFIVASVLAALVCAAAGAIALARALHGLATRVKTMTIPELDLDGARRAIERIQEDVTLMTALFERMQRALQAIDTEVRAMLRVFSQE